jgi:hypothetical protein
MNLIFSLICSFKDTLEPHSLLQLYLQVFASIQQTVFSFNIAVTMTSFPSATYTGKFSRVGCPFIKIPSMQSSRVPDQKTLPLPILNNFL